MPINFLLMPTSYFELHALDFFPADEVSFIVFSMFAIEEMLVLINIIARQ